MDKIVGKQIHSIHRVSDMLCLNFGGNIKRKIKKTVRNVPEYSLHIQCPWVIKTNKEVILGSMDIYQPYNENVPEDWDYDEMNRKNEESSIFDVKTKQLADFMGGAIVKQSYVDQSNNIVLCFENGWIFKTFIASSKKHEFWRYINFHNGEHRVMYDID